MEQPATNPIDNPETVDWSDMESACWEAVVALESQMQSALGNPNMALNLLVLRASAIGSAAACRQLAEQDKLRVRFPTNARD
jgi:hypothetical protein